MADLKLELQPFVSRMVKIEKQVDKGEDIDYEEVNKLLPIIDKYVNKYGLGVLDILDDLIQAELSKN